jgi:hypothetical protein
MTKLAIVIKRIGRPYRGLGVIYFYDIKLIRASGAHLGAESLEAANSFMLSFFTNRLPSLFFAIVCSSALPEKQESSNA